MPNKQPAPEDQAFLALKHAFPPVSTRLSSLEPRGWGAGGVCLKIAHDSGRQTLRSGYVNRRRGPEPGRNGSDRGRRCYSEKGPPEPACGRRGRGGPQGPRGREQQEGGGRPAGGSRGPGPGAGGRRRREQGGPAPRSPHGRERAAVAAALTGPGRAGAWAAGKMSAGLEQKEQQERLREAAALGDIREVQKLVESGVDVNSQNEVNGW